MKIYGYEKEQERLIQLSEVSIQASVEELRSLARFLVEAAATMETHGVKFGHEHYRDWVGQSFQGGADLIVASPPDPPS